MGSRLIPRAGAARAECRVAQGAAGRSRASRRRATPATSRRLRRRVCGRSVRAADKPADRAAGDARQRVELEVARAAVGGAVEVVGRRGSAAQSAHGRSTSGDGRLGGTGHHGCTVAFWRAVIAMWAIGCASDARSCRYPWPPSEWFDERRASGPGAGIGRSNRVGASDGLPREYGAPRPLRQRLRSLHRSLVESESNTGQTPPRRRCYTTLA